MASQLTTSFQARANPLARTQRAQQIAAWQTPVGANFQRTYGNHAVSRFLQRAPAQLIQRDPNDDKEDEEEKQDASKPQNGGAPLMLTDRPWSEIENNGMPKFNANGTPQIPQLFGRQEMKFPRVNPGLAEMLKANAPEPEKPAPVLLLTEKPWAQIEAERLQQEKDARKAEVKEEQRLLFISNLEQRIAEARRKQGAYDFAAELAQFEAKRMDAESKKQYGDLATSLAVSNELGKIEQSIGRRSIEVQQEREARRSAEKAKNANDRESYLANLKARINTAMERPGGPKYMEELKAVANKYTSNDRAKASLGSDAVRANIDSKITEIEQKHQDTIDRNETLTALRKRIKELQDAAKPVATHLSERTNIANYDKIVTFFDAPRTEKGDLDATAAPLALVRSEAIRRVGLLKNHIEAIQSDPEDTSKIAPARAAVVDPADASILGQEAVLNRGKTALVAIANMGNVVQRKREILDNYKLAPKNLLDHVHTWLSKKYSFGTDLSKAEFTAKIDEKLLEQYNVPKVTWIRDILGYKLIQRPQGRLYMYEGPKIELTNKNNPRKTKYGTHVSIFADTVAAGAIRADGTRDGITNTLLASSANPMQAAHVTMEIYEHGKWPSNANPNPHIYRGGPSQKKQLNDKTNDAWASVAPDPIAGTPGVTGVEDKLRQVLTDEIDRAKNAVDPIIAAKGTPLWPNL